VTAAKALGLAWGKETLGVNHLQAHLYAALMPKPEWGIDGPMIGLVVSGGHTALVHMDGIHRFKLLGQTRDDAVGEAFDKVAKLLGLGFPGGPEIEGMAKEGNPKAFRFTRPKIKSGSPYDFSYSGVKTAVFYKVQDELRRSEKVSGALSTGFVADMAASFQHFVVEELVEKTLQACWATRSRRLVVGGGVIANAPLRERLKEVCSDLKMELAIPPMDLCTDNGAMVAGLGHHRNPVSPWQLRAIPDLTVELN
jgi:N6-L-threonylcarbamoyladenine synthase